MMGDSGDSSRNDSPIMTNGRDSKTSEADSPPSVTRSLPRSNTSSPLLDTGTIPLDDPTVCPYCHRNFRKPRVLDCLHSMCEDCIIAQLDGRREAEKAQELAIRSSLEVELETPEKNERPTPPGVIRCAVCAQESHVGNDVRYVHSMLIDYVRLSEVEEQSGAERKCRACKSEQLAVAVCKQCMSDLCPTCLDAHRNMRMFDGHQVMVFAQLDLTDQKQDSRLVFCPSHGQPFKMLCATCETLGCKMCLELEHGSNHKLIEVNGRVVTAIQAELNTLSEKVDSKWRESMNQWEAIPDRHANLETQYENARAKVDLAFEEIVRAVEEMRLKKIVELDTARDKQDELIAELYKKVDLTQARVSDAVSFTERLVTKANGMELLASRRKVIQQLTNLRHTMPVLTTQFELEYQPLNKKQLDSQLSNACGTVSCRTVSSTVKESSATPVFSPSQSENQLNEAAKEAFNSVQIQMPRTASEATLTNGVGGGPGAIGMERKKTSVSTSRGEFNNGWPPSSNPPDLPSPSPPKDPNGAANLANANSASSGSVTAASIYNNYQWPPSSAPLPTSAPPPDTRVSAAAALQTQLSGLVAASAASGGLPFGNTTHSQAQAAAAAQLTAAQSQLLGMNAQQLQIAKAALLMQQQLNPLGALGNLGNLSGLSNPLQSLQQRFRAGGLDPLSVGLGSLNLDPAALPRAQTELTLGSKNFHSELRMHSLFGSGVPGQSVRELNCPGGFCLADNDDILIADMNNHRIVVCGPPHPWIFGRAGQEDGSLCYPRKVVALKGDAAKGDSTRYVVIDKGTDNKSRAQIFDHRGEFVRRINLNGVIAKGGLDVQAACSTLAGHLVLVDHGGVVYSLDVDQITPRVVGWFDTSARLGEATDVAVFDKNFYITDFKNHCVHVFSMDGTYIKRLGEPSVTPYPIGVDVSKGGDVLVADTHGNHLHVVVFPANDDTRTSQSFTHQEFKMSRCVGLRVAASGHIVTLSKHNHTLFVFKPLWVR